MAWTPTPADQLPPPDMLLALFDPAPGEPDEGYITPADMKALTQAVCSAIYWLENPTP